MLKRNVQNLNKEYLLICIVKVGVHVSTLNTPSQQPEFLLFRWTAVAAVCVASWRQV